LRGDGMVRTEFEVKDTGIGMSLEAQGRLFRPFEQEDSSTSRRFGGTGLGLNISKQIVEAMGGSIRVQSAQGQGSTFSFSTHLLPGLAEKIEHRYAITPARIGEVLKGRRLKILFAEDNATTQFLVREVMEMWGHAITVAENGKQAVAKAQTEAFDIVLMDMQMPVMDGAEAVRMIRRGEAAGAAVPIIALTADAIPESRARYLEAGCDAVVTKPIEWHVLAREMKVLIARAQHLPLETEPEFMTAAAAEKDRPDAAALPVFDRQRIDGLSDGLGPVLMGNLLARCLASMEQYLSNTLRNAEEGDFIAVQRSAHDLKSVCAQFGAIRASELARIIEAELPDLEAVKAALPELTSSVEGAAASIQGIQDEMGASGSRSGRSAA